MDAIPLAPPIGIPTLPDAVAPSQADYARPGLPGERELVDAPAAVAAEPAQLTPEEEVRAEFAEPAEPEPAVAEVAPPDAAPEPPVAARSATGGLRFAEEIGELRDLDDETTDRPDRRPQRGRRRGSAAPERQRQVRGSGGGRRFEIDEADIELGLSELHGELPDDDFDDDDDDENVDEDV